MEKGKELVGSIIDELINSIKRNSNIDKVEFVNKVADISDPILIVLQIILELSEPIAKFIGNTTNFITSNILSPVILSINRDIIPDFDIGDIFQYLYQLLNVASGALGDIREERIIPPGKDLQTVLETVNYFGLPFGDEFFEVRGDEVIQHSPSNIYNSEVTMKNYNQRNLNLTTEMSIDSDSGNEKYAIIISTNSKWNDVKLFNKVLLEDNFDRIYILDGSAATSDNFESTILQVSHLVDKTDEVFIAIASHGNYGSMTMSDNKILEYSDLDIWLDMIIAQKITISIDNCYSGSSVKYLSEGSCPRFVYTSCDANEVSNGVYHFLFASALEKNSDFYFIADYKYGNRDGNVDFYEANLFAKNFIKDRNSKLDRNINDNILNEENREPSTIAKIIIAVVIIIAVIVILTIFISNYFAPGPGSNKDIDTNKNPGYKDVFRFNDGVCEFELNVVFTFKKDDDDALNLELIKEIMRKFQREWYDTTDGYMLLTKVHFYWDNENIENANIIWYNDDENPSTHLVMDSGVDIFRHEELIGEETAIILFRSINGIDYDSTITGLNGQKLFGQYLNFYAGKYIAGCLSEKTGPWKGTYNNLGYKEYEPATDTPDTIMNNPERYDEFSYKKLYDDNPDYRDTEQYLYDGDGDENPDHKSGWETYSDNWGLRKKSNYKPWMGPWAMFHSWPKYREH